MNLGSSITRHGFLLGVFALVSTFVIAATWLSTKDRIAVEQRKAEEKALLELAPRSSHDNSMLDDTLMVGPETTGLGLREPRKIYLARLAGKVVTAIIPAVAPDGYSGEIGMIVGVAADGSVTGVRVLTHRETPGLGDQVDLKKSDWILEFGGKSLANPTPDLWKVNKDGGVFDTFTGATITPRAVVSATRRVLEYVQTHQTQLFDAPLPLNATLGREGDEDG